MTVNRGTPMDAGQASLAFLRDTAAKHFVYLSFRVTRGGSPLGRGKDFASCFVVEIDGHWLLVTAGHVINKIRRYKEDGITVSDFNLHDKLAGNLHEFSVPYHFDLDEWVVLEDDPAGTDYAVAPLSIMFVLGLKAGGIRPISEVAFGSEPFDQYPVWLLTGIPIESLAVVKSKMVMKLTLMSLKPTTPPSGAAKVAPGSRVYAKLISQPGHDKVTINDIDGMSGSPIFGLRAEGDKVLYWLIGVQSSWHPDTRVVSFCPLPHFLRAIKEGIRQHASSPSPAA